MVPGFRTDGNLPEGVHCTTWAELVARFGYTDWRSQLLAGMRQVLESLRNAGCKTAYIGGSFVTEKEIPSDFDICYDTLGLDPTLLDPVLRVFDADRATQKAKFLGESFPSDVQANAEGDTYLEFLQQDHETDEPKGIITLDVEGME